jgi:hypothetical protein
VSDPPLVLPDGRYDAFVVDATEQPDDVIHMELTIVAGDHKGEVVEIAARGLGRSEIDLLGMPATITVSAGEPHLQLDG